MDGAQDRAEALVSALRRGALDVALVAKTLASPSQPLLHAAGCQDERAGDLVGRQPHHGREREGCALSLFERGVTASEQEPKELVLPTPEHLRLRDSDARPRAELRQQVDSVTMALRPAGAPNPVAVRVLGHGDEPGFSRIRCPRFTPALQRALDRVVNGILGVHQRPRDAHHLGEHARIDSPDRVRVLRPAHGRQRQSTGRTSIAWC
jgi:hypothetical protein